MMLLFVMFQFKAFHNIVHFFFFFDTQQSSAYKNTVSINFHTQEPEHFDVMPPESDPLLQRQDSVDEQNRAQTAANILLAGVVQGQTFVNRPRVESSGSYWSDNERIIYKRMTPQGLSPIDKDCPANQWDSEVIPESTGTRADNDSCNGIDAYVKQSMVSGEPSTAGHSRASSCEGIDSYVKQSRVSGASSTASSSRASLLAGNGSRASSQDTTGHHLAIPTPCELSANDRVNSQESDINNYTQQGQAQGSDEIVYQRMTPQGLSPINKESGNQWDDFAQMISDSITENIRDSDSCNGSIDSYARQSALPETPSTSSIRSCDSSATSSPMIGCQSNSSSPSKNGQKTCPDDLHIANAIKSLQRIEQSPETSIVANYVTEARPVETNDTQASAVANYVKAGVTPDELQTNSNEISVSDPMASFQDDQSETSGDDDMPPYVQSAVQRRHINITENPLSSAQSAEQIDDYVTHAQNLNNFNSNNSLNAAPCCSNDECTPRSRLENTDIRSSSPATIEAPYVVHGSAHSRAGGASNAAIVDIEPSKTNSSESPQGSNGDPYSTTREASKDESESASVANDSAINITVTSSSLPSSTEHLFRPIDQTKKEHQTDSPYMPWVARDFNSNLNQTSSCPNLPQNNGYLPVSALIRTGRPPSLSSPITPSEAAGEALVPLLPKPTSPLGGSDDGYSSHGNSAPPSPNALVDGKNLEGQHKVECADSQYQPNQNASSDSNGYIAFSAL